MIRLRQSSGFLRHATPGRGRNGDRCGFLYSSHSGGGVSPIDRCEAPSFLRGFRRQRIVGDVAGAYGQFASDGGCVFGARLLTGVSSNPTGGAGVVSSPPCSRVAPLYVLVRRSRSPLSLFSGWVGLHRPGVVKGATAGSGAALPFTGEGRCGKWRWRERGRGLRAG